MLDGAQKEQDDGAQKEQDNGDAENAGAAMNKNTPHHKCIKLLFNAAVAFLGRLLPHESRCDGTVHTFTSMFVNIE